VKVGIETVLLSFGSLIVCGPGIEQGIRRGQGKAFVGLICPFSFAEGRADGADMADTDIGFAGEFHDAPLPARMAEQGPQDTRGLGFEERAQRPFFGFRRAGDQTLDEHRVEGDMGIALEIQEPYAFLLAQMPGLFGQIGGNHDRDRAGTLGLDIMS